MIFFYLYATWSVTYKCTDMEFNFMGIVNNNKKGEAIFLYNVAYVVSDNELYGQNDNFNKKNTKHQKKN